MGVNVRVLHLISGGDSGGAKTHVLSLLRDLNDNIDADLVCYMEADFSKEAREMGIPTRVFPGDRKSTRLNSSHIEESRMPSSA